MCDTVVAFDDNKPMSLFFDFTHDINDNNQHLLCGIIEDLWSSQESICTENKLNANKCNKNSINEDLCELQAYLYEIDMNLEYFRNDYQEFKEYDLDINIDKLLSFKFSQDACNMIMYENEISNRLKFSTNKPQLAEIFAHVDAIPEFVPNSYQTELLSEDTDMMFDMNDEIVVYDDDITTAGLFDDYFMNDGTSGDIFENVYNYIPDAEEDDEEEEITVSSDDNSSGCDVKKLNKWNYKNKKQFKFCFAT